MRGLELTLHALPSNHLCVHHLMFFIKSEEIDVVINPHQRGEEIEAQRRCLI